MQLSLDAWDGARVAFQETTDPGLRQVLDAVGHLDGTVHTEVSLKRDDPFEYLTISGGPDFFVVSGEARDEALVRLTSPDAPEGTVELTCGGQVSTFDLHDVVPRHKIESAVEQFFAGLSANLPGPWVVE